MDPPSPAAAELLELAEKYRTLAGLRAQKDGGPVQATRAILQPLAARFPGCLRELDTLGSPELERRARAAEAAAADGAREPWMAWIWAYHRLMRAALTTKRAVARAPLDPGQIEALAVQAEHLAGFPLGGAFVRAVAAPPQGRLGVMVLEQLAAVFGAPAAAIADALFPRRRPAPYTLGGS
jgi:hypothetical protein